MINCPKCGADNMIGAIFCRTCGEKLNLKDLSPDVFDAPPVPASVRIAQMVQRIVILVVVVALVGLIGGLFWPVAMPVSPSLDEQAMRVAQNKYQALQSPQPRTPAQIPFSAAEATAVVNRALNLPSSAGGNKKPQAISIEFMDSGTCRLRLKSLVFGQLPMVTTLTVRPTVPSPGTVQMQVLKASIGKLPLPGGLRQQGIAQFTALNPASIMANARSHVKEASIVSGNCTITIKR